MPFVVAPAAHTRFARIPCSVGDDEESVSLPRPSPAFESLAGSRPARGRRKHTRTTGAHRFPPGTRRAGYSASHVPRASFERERSRRSQVARRLHTRRNRRSHRVNDRTALPTSRHNARAVAVGSSCPRQSALGPRETPGPIRPASSVQRVLRLPRPRPARRKIADPDR